MALAAIFPGQGSQFPGMADPWTAHEAGREIFDEASRAMGRDVVADCRDDEALATTDFVQPALARVRRRGVPRPRAEGVRSNGRRPLARRVRGARRRRCARPRATRSRWSSPVDGRCRRPSQERPGTMTALLGVGTERRRRALRRRRPRRRPAVANENSPSRSCCPGSVPASSAPKALAAVAPDPRDPPAGRGRLPLAADAARGRAAVRGDRPGSGSASRDAPSSRT